jgi:pimeloyl-ACP methyl ester carboxylesterase
MRVMAYDDTGGRGRLVVMLPGAGDVRSEYRFLTGPLVDAGYRVVAADLPGHGDSTVAGEYTVESTAAALVELLENLDGGPAVVVACSFSPAAAVWAAAERPELFAGIVSLSPHFHDDSSVKGRVLNWAIRGMLRGPWAAGVWAKLYAGWYKTNPPTDLPIETREVEGDAVSDPARRRAVRETLVADREGVAERMLAIDVPTLTIFGSLDDHFADPVAMAAETATELTGEKLVVEGAGHYPHVEKPRSRGRCDRLVRGGNSPDAEGRSHSGRRGAGGGRAPQSGRSPGTHPGTRRRRARSAVTLALQPHRRTRGAGT